MWIKGRLLSSRLLPAALSALIGASNFFELAVAVAIILLGIDSVAALATLVGVLVKVPVMLSVVEIVNASKGWYARGALVGKENNYPVFDDSN